MKKAGKARFISDCGPSGQVDAYCALVAQMLDSYYPFPFSIMYFSSSFGSL